MANVKAILAKNSKKKMFIDVDYDEDKRIKELAYIDKFLKIISKNSKLTIVYKDVPTAFINIATQEVTLPNYIVADKDIYLLLGSHEISHAIHTPNLFYDAHNKRDIEYDDVEINGIKLNKVLFSCINVVEDIRIERLIREKFPGFVSIHQNAYKKLLKNNFFEIDNIDWTTMNIANKMNLKDKLGNLAPYTFTKEENDLYIILKDTITFDDVLDKSVMLYKLLLKENLNNDINDDLKFSLESSNSNGKSNKLSKEELQELLDNIDNMDINLDKLKENSSENHEHSSEEQELLDKLSEKLNEYANSVNSQSDILDESVKKYEKEHKNVHVSNVNNNSFSDIIKNPRQYITSIF